MQAGAGPPMGEGRAETDPSHMGTSLMADGVLEGLRDRVALQIKAASHWN